MADDSSWGESYSGNDQSKHQWVPEGLAAAVLPSPVSPTPQVPEIQKSPLPTVAPIETPPTNPLGAMPSVGGMSQFNQGSNKQLANALMAAANRAQSEGEVAGPNPSLLGTPLSPLLSQQQYPSGNAQAPLAQEAPGSSLDKIQAQRMNQPIRQNLPDDERKSGAKENPTEGCE